MKAQNLIFIKSGIFKLMRKIGFKINTLTKSISINDFSEPKFIDYTRGEATSVLLELDEVGLNSCLCNYENFHKTPMFYSAVTFMPSETITVSFYEFKNILKLNRAEHIIELMKEEAKPFPEDLKIRKQFIELQKWDLFKHKTVMNTMIDYKNEKN